MSSNSKISRGLPIRPRNRSLVQIRPGPSTNSPKSFPVIRKGKDCLAANAGNAGGEASTASCPEDLYQLLPSSAPLGKPFAMIIRLQPEILEELKQADAEGRELSMKFGLNAAEHEIRVGSETFKFLSAPEPGDLCDIYEEKSCESGGNFLVEAGSVWRKLSVLRILSATEKDRVKQRTTEAEKKQKLRKSILVDSSTQKAISTAAASEVNRKLPSRTSREPLSKKQRVISPFLSQNVTRPLAEKLEKVTMLEKMNVTEKINVSEIINMPEKMNVSEKFNEPKKIHAPEKPCLPVVNRESPRLNVSSHQMQISTSRNRRGSGPASDMVVHLQKFLISHLQENPMGISMKAIEKAVHEGFSCSLSKKAIEKAVKSIAMYRAPGRYVLKPGVEKESKNSTPDRLWVTACRTTPDDVPSTTLSLTESASKAEKLAASEKKDRRHTFPHSSAMEAVYSAAGLPEDKDTRDQGTLSNYNRVHKRKNIRSRSSDSLCTSSDSDSGSDSDSTNDSDSDSDSDSSSSSGESIDKEMDMISDDDRIQRIRKKTALKEADSLACLQHAKYTGNVEMACADSREVGELISRKDRRTISVQAEHSRDNPFTEARSRALIQRRSSSPDLDDSPGRVTRRRVRSKNSYYCDLDAPRQRARDPLTANRSIENDGKEQSAVNKQEVSEAGSKENGRIISEDIQEHFKNLSNGLVVNTTKAEERQGESKGKAYSNSKLSQVPATVNGNHMDKSRTKHLMNLTGKEAVETVGGNGTEPFAPCEKLTAVLRGPIQNYEEYKEYCNEFRKKYPTYDQLHLAIEAYRKEFEIFKDVEYSKHEEKEIKLSHICQKMQNNYFEQRKVCKLKYHVLQVLHEELRMIKMRCKEYADKVSQS